MQKTFFTNSQFRVVP